jgi:hypothetical protein
MKNSLRFNFVFFIVIIAFVIDSCTPKDKKFGLEELPLVISTDDTVKIVKKEILVRNFRNPHTVILLVDTDNITHGSPATIKSYCSFPDLGPNDPIADYTTHVLPGDPIKWIGVPISDPNDVVCIEMINHRSGNNVYGGPIHGVNCRVEGNIRDDAQPRQEETYAIHFSVINNGDTSGMYILDPKLLVH